MAFVVDSVDEFYSVYQQANKVQYSRTRVTLSLVCAVDGAVAMDAFSSPSYCTRFESGTQFTPTASSIKND